LIGETEGSIVVVGPSLVVVAGVVVVGALVVGASVVVVVTGEALAAMKIPVPMPATSTTAAIIEIALWEVTHWVIVENMAEQSRAAPSLHH
jgi:hypothetical protein